MEKVRFGIVGLGNQGSVYLLTLFDKGKIENGEVTAVCDINPAKIEIIKKKTVNKNIVYFTDYKQMLGSGLCDAVLVETPHYLHPEIVEECLKRDINVICDKPAGVYTKQVREMNAAAEKSKARFGMMFNQRTNCVYRKMKEVVEEGGVGELQRVTWIITDWFRTQKYFDSGSWRATWNGEGGGVLINQCPHQLDLIQWVVGKIPVAVSAFCKYGQWHDIEVEDEVTAYLEYEGGATGVFITSTGEYPGENRFEICGTKGKIVCEGDKLTYYKNRSDSADCIKTAKEPFVVPEYDIIPLETDGKNPQHEGVINAFVKAILNGDDDYIKGEEGVYGVQLMNAIEMSGWNGGARVTIPFDEDEYLKQLDAHRKLSKFKDAKDDEVFDTTNTFGSVKK